MADDGSSKGHGGKPGRKSTVISMSAHKSRHSGEGDGPSKKLSGLTLFDFSPSESIADEAVALPCENTPFERDAGPDQPTNSSPGRKFLRWGLDEGGLGEPFQGDKDAFEDESHIQSPGNPGSDFLDGEGDRFSKPVRKKSRDRHQWDHKSGRSGSLVESFYHAIHGLRVGFARQRNVRIHCGIALAVLLLALTVKVDAMGWLALGLATGFVFFAEYVNTAIEHVTDIQANFRYHRSARYAKDTAAAAVLIAAATAVLVGAIVFVPRIFALMSGNQ